MGLKIKIILAALTLGLALPADAKERKSKRSKKGSKAKVEKVDQAENPEKNLEKSEKSDKKEEKSGNLASPTEPKKKASGGRIGLLGGLGYEKITFSKNDTSTDYTGFGLIGGGEYMHSLGSTFKVSGGAGIHYVSLSGAKESVSFSLSETSLIFQGTGFFYLTPKVGAGVFLSFDYGLTGSQSATFGEETVVVPTASWTELNFGPRIVLDTTAKLSLTSELGIGSGSATAQAAEDAEVAPEAESFSAFTLRFGVLYWLF